MSIVFLTICLLIQMMYWILGITLTWFSGDDPSGMIMRVMWSKCDFRD
jgi:hypothetical protein